MELKSMEEQKHGTRQARTAWDREGYMLMEV